MVYGTLMREMGHPCHAILAAKTEFKGPVCFHGEIYDLGPYPALRIAPDVPDIVHGELYRLLHANDVLAELDSYEGNDPRNPGSSLYCREAVDVFHGDGSSVKAWVYRYNGSLTGKPKIASGNYPEFCRTRRAVDANCN